MARRVSFLQPALAVDDRHHATGDVDVPVVLMWLKGGPVATATLTPWQAIHLAHRLLLAAEDAELAHDVRRDI